MKVRKLAVALALAGGLGSGLAHALGMGEGRILTNLNEPLRAEIELSEPGQLSADQIKVSLASESEFERAGLRRMDMLRRLEFDVVETGSGYQIQVTSDGPIREPFLNFLVELTWPNGRMLREYSFLVDPPSRSTEQQAIGPSADTGTGDTGTGQQGRASAGEERRQQQPRGPSGPAADTPDEYGPTGANDTLWGIAGQVSRSRELNRHQVMLAIQDANPNAFMNSNINQLRRGQVLRIPSEQAMRSRSKQEAIQQVMAQNERHQQRSGGRQASAGTEAPQASRESATSTAGQGAAGESSAEGEDELRILVADDGSNGEDGTTAGMGDGEGDERLAAALEELDRAKRDREELSERLADLESQIETMSQLIELKDDQLAEMEQRLAEARENAGESAGASAGSDGGEGQPASDVTTSEAGGSEPSGAGETDATSSSDKTAEQTQVADTGDQDEGSDRSGPDDADGTNQDNEPAVAAASGDESDDGDPVAEREPDQGQGADESGTTEAADPKTPSSLNDVFQRIVNDPRYQIGAGVLGIALLGLLWGLARRNAAREQAFYDQLKDVSHPGEEPDEEEDVLELGESGDETTAESTEEDAQRGGEDDALAEADVYLAYGRHGQAVQHLEDAISGEPSRVDLRLKLLEVYADTGQAENFEKQYRELRAFNDDEALRSADELRSRLDNLGEDVSLDDLSEQLKTGTGSESAQAEELEDDDEFDFSALDEADDLLGEASGTETSGSVGSEEASDSDNDSIDFDLSDEAALGEPLVPDEETSGEATEPERSPGADSEEDVADIGFSVDDLELEEPGESAEPAASPDEEVPELDVSSDAEQDDAGIDLESLEKSSTELREPTGESADTADAITLDDLDLEAGADDAADASAGGDSEEQAETGSGSEAPASTDFDDSFLEELDAELDRVTEEETEESAPQTVGTEAAGNEPEASPEPQELGDSDELDDLSLDVSEEDLELANEVAQEGVGEEPEASSDQFEESLMDSDMDDLGAESELSDEELAALEGEGVGQGQGEEEEAADMGADSEPAQAGQSTAEAEDDEFDFLEGTDESGTKLDLARAYVEMGDADGARDILEEVAREGSEEQQQEAQRLLNEL